MTKKDLQSYVGHLFVYKYSDSLYQLVTGISENDTHPTFIVEQIGGIGHGMIRYENQFDFLSKYKMVS
jgi:hypothetical protein